MNEIEATYDIVEGGRLKKENLKLLSGCLILGLLFDYLFYKKGPGVSYPIFIIAFYLFFMWNTRKKLVTRLTMGWLLVIPVFLLSITFSLYQNMVFGILNFMLIPVLMVIQTLLVTGSNVHPWDSFRFGVDVIYGAFARPLAYIFKPFEVIGSYFTFNRSQGKNSTLKKILTGIFVSIPLLIVILALLSSADLVFSRLLYSVTSIFSPTFFENAIIHLILVFFVLFTVFSYTWSIVRSERKPPLLNSELKLTASNPDPVIIQTVLSLLNLVYLLFVVIQFTYLFSSMTSFLPSGLTYAEYARKGFFELVAVTVINLCVLTASMLFTKTTTKRHKLIARILQTLLVGCTFIMLISAYFRMLLYEEAYGYTYMRLFTHFFMIFLFAIFLVTVLGIWKNGFRLFKPYVAIALIFYVAINFANVDKMIVENNIERYGNTGDIDVNYLAGLSNDCVPELTRFLSNNPDKPELNPLKDYLARKKKDLLKPVPWQMFSLSRHNAANALSK